MAERNRDRLVFASVVVATLPADEDPAQFDITFFGMFRVDAQKGQDKDAKTKKK